jgi:hypothetical protein
MVTYETCLLFSAHLLRSELRRKPRLNVQITHEVDFALGEKCRRALEKDLGFEVPIPKSVAKKLAQIGTTLLC